MRLKDLFTVPTGQKITERHLRRVLLSSVCSILLCMTCLVSTTWAWFMVSIENTENVIQIAIPGIKLSVDGIEASSASAGTHLVRIEHANELDDLQKKSTLYVTLTIQCGSNSTAVYTTLNQENQYATDFTIVADAACELSWEVSWFAPASADEISDAVIAVTAEDDTDSSTEPTTPPSTEAVAEPSTDQTTDPTTAIPPETNPTESSQTDTTATTNPSAETTASTETTAPTEATTPVGTTAPTETATPPTEATAPTETTVPSETTVSTEATD